MANTTNTTRNIPSELPEVEFVDTDTEALVNKLIAGYEEITGRTLYPADPCKGVYPLACKCNHTGKGKYQRIGKTEPTKIRHRTKLGFIKRNIPQHLQATAYGSEDNAWIQHYNST